MGRAPRPSGSGRGEMLPPLPGHGRQLRDGDWGQAELLLPTAQTHSYLFLKMCWQNYSLQTYVTSVQFWILSHHRAGLARFPLLPILDSVRELPPCIPRRCHTQGSSAKSDRPADQAQSRKSGPPCAPPAPQGPGCLVAWCHHTGAFLSAPTPDQSFWGAEMACLVPV